MTACMAVATQHCILLFDRLLTLAKDAAHLASDAAVPGLVFRLCLLFVDAIDAEPHGLCRTTSL